MGVFTGMAVATEASSELAIVLRATLVLLATLALLAMTGRTKASVRHLLLATMFGALVVLPAVIRLAPAIDIQVLNQTNRNSAGGQVSSGGTASDPADAVVTPFEQGASAGNSWGSFVSWTSGLRAVWLIGVLLSLLPLAGALFQIRRTCRQSVPWSPGAKRYQATESTGHRQVAFLTPFRGCAADVRSDAARRASPCQHR